MVYIGSVLGSLFTTLFFIFIIATIGYLIGGLEIKGISLGTAGVLLVALLFGILASKVGTFTVGETDITLWSGDIKKMFSLVSNIGTALFVSGVGLIAGPKFFRSFNKSTMSYILMGVIIILAGFVAMAICVALGVEPAMAIGLLTGALTSTPGLASAKEAFAAGEEQVTSGYGIAYIFGVLGVVFFVQIIPRILKVNIPEEREKFKAANAVTIPEPKRKLKKLDSLDFFPFMTTVALGIILGTIKIPGINFSLGSSGGTLIVGLIIGHFGHIGPIDMHMTKNTLNVFRELGLMLFLIGAGVPGGVNFITHFKPIYFVYGVIMTTLPMVIGFIFAKYVFKLSIFNNLGSITGGMTSTPALGTLVSVAGTDDVTSAYAATYPIALVIIVVLSKVFGMICG